MCMYICTMYRITKCNTQVLGIDLFHNSYSGEGHEMARGGNPTVIYDTKVRGGNQNCHL